MVVWAIFQMEIKKVAGSDTSYGNSYAVGDIIGIAIDLDNNKLYLVKMAHGKTLEILLQVYWNRSYFIRSSFK